MFESAIHDIDDTVKDTANQITRLLVVHPTVYNVCEANQHRKVVVSLLQISIVSCFKRSATDFSMIHIVV